MGLDYLQKVLYEQDRILEHIHNELEEMVKVRRVRKDWLRSMLRFVKERPSTNSTEK
jgi:hypothetical protein